MKAIKITAKAATAYQYNSISRFGMHIQRRANGSFYSEQFFNSFEDAIEYLEKRALMYADTEEELNAMMEEIRTYHQLTIDACTATIEL